MKTLTVPFIDGLESMAPESVDAQLEAAGSHCKVDIAGWSDFPEKPDVDCRVAASRDYLFVKFAVNGTGLKAEFDKTNDPVWQDSCVEVFVGDADGRGYRNFEVNCIGTLLSAHQEGRGVNVVPITDADATRVIRHASTDRRTFEEIDGVHQWTVTVGIPFSLLGRDARPSMLRVNFYKCADGSRWPHYLSWSPIDTPEPDFHRPEFFGTLILEPEK